MQDICPLTSSNFPPKFSPLTSWYAKFSYLTNNDVNFIQIFGVIKILQYICIQKNLNVKQMVKHLYIIAGCNGAGKTTASNKD